MFFDHNLEREINKLKKSNKIIQFSIAHSLEKIIKDIIFFKTKKINLSYLNFIDQYKIFSGGNCNIYFSKNIIYTIITEWSGLTEFIKYFKDKFKNNPDINTKILILEHEINRCLTTIKDTRTKLFEFYPDLIEKDMGIEIRTNIKTKYFVEKDKIYSIPTNKMITINKLNIYTDSNGYITSVKLDSKHPNADDNGWYCLGKLKYLPLSVESVELLKSKIEAINLDDCYWKLTL